MPAATRERALRGGRGAARRGGRARVEPCAGRRTGRASPGSTSNWFRTRRALLGGIVDWIAERERADLEPAAMPTISGVDELIEGLCAMAELQTGPFAARTRARYASSSNSPATLSLASRCGGSDASSSGGLSGS